MSYKFGMSKNTIYELCFYWFITSCSFTLSILNHWLLFISIPSIAAMLVYSYCFKFIYSIENEITNDKIERRNKKTGELYYSFNRSDIVGVKVEKENGLFRTFKLTVFLRYTTVEFLGLDQETCDRIEEII